MTRYPLRPHLKMLIYAMLPVAVTQPTYKYSVQICYTILPMHWAHNKYNDCSGAKWLPAPSQTGVIPPNFDQISILATGQYHATRDCYCCLSFPSKLFTFPMNLCLWEWLYLLSTVRLAYLQLHVSVHLRRTAYNMK